MNHGFLILDKPVGITSAKAVAAVKKALGCNKIGHGGTLDPLASGVLPLAIGEATKAFEFVASSIKEYSFEVTFGEERDTEDAEGKVTATTEALPTRAQIEAALPQFKGPILQTPPIYSALKIGGQRAYALARAGEAVEMEPREVVIFNIALLSCIDEQDIDPFQSNISPSRLREGSGEGAQAAFPPPSPPASGVRVSSAGVADAIRRATFRVTCGKGTYVRSLARDIARKCNSLGYVSALRRTRVGKFTEANAISLDKLEDFMHNPALFKAWVPIELALDDIPAIDLDPRQAQAVRHGQTLRLLRPQGIFMALHQGRIVALMESLRGVLKPYRVFNVN